MNNKNHKNSIHETKKNFSYFRQKSMNNFHNNQKNEKVIPIKRNIKSRGKEIKGIKILPLINKQIFNPKKNINNIPKSKDIIKKKDNNILPNLNKINIKNIKNKS